MSRADRRRHANGPWKPCAGGCGLLVHDRVLCRSCIIPLPAFARPSVAGFEGFFRPELARARQRSAVLALVFTIALFILLAFAGCTTPAIVYRNERNPDARLHEDQAYCEDWALWRLGTMTGRDGQPRSFQSLRITCLRDRGWTVEVWELP